MLTFIFIPYSYVPEIDNPSKITEDMILDLYSSCQKLVNSFNLKICDENNLAVRCFKDKNIFKQLLSLVSPAHFFQASGMEFMEFSEWTENFSNLRFDCYFTSSSLFFTQGGDKKLVLERIYEFLKRNNLKYDPLKLNPVTGQYGFFSTWLYTISYDGFLTLEKWANDYKKNLDYYHKNEFGIPLILDFGRYRLDSILKRLHEKGQGLDFTKIPINVEQMTFDKENYDFKIKKGKMSTWTSEELVKEIDLRADREYKPKEFLEQILEFSDQNLLKNIVDGKIKVSSVLPVAVVEEVLENLSTYYSNALKYGGDAMYTKHQYFYSTDPIKPEPKYSYQDEPSVDYLYDYLEKQAPLINPSDVDLRNVKYAVDLAILIFQSIYFGFKPLPDGRTVCSDQYCGDCEKNQAKFRKEIDSKDPLKTILKPKELVIFSRIFSEFAARRATKGQQLKTLIGYAEKNGVILDINTQYEGRKLIEIAALSDDDITSPLLQLLNYIERKKIVIDLSSKNQYGENLVETMQSKLEKLEDLLNFVLSKPACVKVEIITRYEIYRLLGKFEEALEYTKDKESDINVLLFKIKILHGQKKYSEAKSICEKVIKIADNLPEPYYRKALSLLEEGDKTGALKFFDYASGKGPDNVLYDINKAEILLEMGKKKEVIEIITEINAKTSDSMNLYFTPSQRELFEKVKKLAQEIAQDSKEDSKKKTIVVKEVVMALNRGINSLEAKLLEQKIDKIEEILSKHQDVLVSSGAADKAAVKKEFELLLKENPKLFNYAKAYYWTLLNYFSAYRILSTGLLEGTVESVANSKENMIVEGAKKVAGFAADVAKSVPIVGGIISGLDGIIDDLYTYVKEKRFDDRINAINKILMYSKDSRSFLEEDISVSIARAAVEIAKSKSKEILAPPEEPKGKIGRMKRWIEEKIEKLKARVFGEKVDMYESHESTIALADVTILLGYLYKNHEVIINNSEWKNLNLGEQLKNISLSGNCEGILEQVPEKTSEKEVKNLEKPATETEQIKNHTLGNSEPKKKSCCEIF